MGAQNNFFTFFAYYNKMTIDNQSLPSLLQTQTLAI